MFLLTNMLNLRIYALAAASPQQLTIPISLPGSQATDSTSLVCLKEAFNQAFWGQCCSLACNSLIVIRVASCFRMLSHDSSHKTVRHREKTSLSRRLGANPSPRPLSFPVEREGIQQTPPGKLLPAICGTKAKIETGPIQ